MRPALGGGLDESQGRRDVAPVIAANLGDDVELRAYLSAANRYPMSTSLKNQNIGTLCFDLASGPVKRHYRRDDAIYALHAL